VLEVSKLIAIDPIVEGIKQMEETTVNRELSVNNGIFFKIRLITKFRKNIPFKIWNGNSGEDTQFFDVSKLGLTQIVSKYDLADSFYDLLGSFISTTYQKVALVGGASLTMHESMISPEIRKTETEVNTGNISYETVIKIMAEIDKQKFIANGSEPEDLYCEITPSHPELENIIKNEYRSVGFTVLKNDPTQTQIGFPFSQVTLYNLFAFGQNTLATLINNRLLESSNPPKTIEYK
jgi:hypothetical protein